MLCRFDLNHIINHTRARNCIMYKDYLDCVMQPLSRKLKLAKSDYQFQTQVLPSDPNSNYVPAEADLPVTGWLNGVFLTFETVEIALNFLKINTDHYPRCKYYAYLYSKHEILLRDLALHIDISSNRQDHSLNSSIECC